MCARILTHIDRYLASAHTSILSRTGQPKNIINHLSGMPKICWTSSLTRRRRNRYSPPHSRTTTADERLGLKFKLSACTAESPVNGGSDFTFASVLTVTSRGTYVRTYVRTCMRADRGRYEHISTYLSLSLSLCEATISISLYPQVPRTRGGH